LRVFNKYLNNNLQSSYILRYLGAAKAARVRAFSAENDPTSEYTRTGD
jgi:hypothetical protein